MFTYEKGYFLFLQAAPPPIIPTPRLLLCRTISNPPPDYSRPPVYSVLESILRKNKLQKYGNSSIFATSPSISSPCPGRCEKMRIPNLRGSTKFKQRIKKNRFSNSRSPPQMIGNPSLSKVLTGKNDNFHSK